MKILTGLLSLAIGIGSVACTASTSHDVGSDRISNLVAVESLYASHQCGRVESDTRVTWVSSSAQLAQIYQGFKRNIRGGKLIIPPDIDFSRDAVVLVEMGQRPTLGYRLELNESVSRIEQGHAEIVLEWVAPARDMMVGQMLTSPCLLLKLERGDYREVWIKDTQGRRRIVATKP